MIEGTVKQAVARLQKPGLRLSRTVRAGEAEKRVVAAILVHGKDRTPIESTAEGRCAIHQPIGTFDKSASGLLAVVGNAGKGMQNRVIAAVLVHLENRPPRGAIRKRRGPVQGSIAADQQGRVGVRPVTAAEKIVKHGEVAAILVQLERGAGMERSPSIGGSIKVSIGSQGKSSLGNQAAVRIRKTLQYGQSRAIRID